MQRPGTAALSMRELRGFLEDRLARHEMPVALEVRENLPRSPLGKLMPSVLVEEERVRAGVG